eukprot:ctg_90.g39
MATNAPDDADRPVDRPRPPGINTNRQAERRIAAGAADSHAATGAHPQHLHRRPHRPRQDDARGLAAGGQRFLVAPTGGQGAVYGLSRGRATARHHHEVGRRDPVASAPVVGGRRRRRRLRHHPYRLAGACGLCGRGVGGSAPQRRRPGGGRCGGGRLQPDPSGAPPRPPREFATGAGAEQTGPVGVGAAHDARRGLCTAAMRARRRQRDSGRLRGGNGDSTCRGERSRRESERTGRRAAASGEWSRSGIDNGGGDLLESAILPARVGQRAVRLGVRWLGLSGARLCAYRGSAIGRGAATAARRAVGRLLLACQTEAHRAAGRGGGGQAARATAVRAVGAGEHLARLSQLYGASAAAADGTLAVRDQIAARVGVAVPERDLHHRDARHALQSLMSRWLPLNRAVLDTVVEHVPSPLQALSARLEMLWPHTRKASPSALQQRAAMRHGDTTPESPLMMLVGKMFHIEASLVPPALRRQLEARAAVENHDADEDGADRPPGSLLALARVFCGSLNSTGNLWVYGPRYRADVGATHQAPYCYEMAGAALNVLLLNGRDFVPLTDSPTKSTARTAIAAGAVVAIAGLDACVLKTATVSSLAPGVCLPFAPLSDIGGARPVVRVALEPAARLSELPRLRRGLRLLSQADPAVETFVSESGELILGVSGELHLERCLTDLRETFARVEIKASSPMIAFRETVAGGVSITPQNPWVTSQRQLPKMRHGEESAAAAAAATHDDEEDANIASESDGMTDAEIVSREPAAAYPDAELLRGLRAGGAVMVPLPNEGIELAIRALPLPLALANGIEAAPLWVLRALFRGRGDRARSTTEWSPATKMLFAELCEAARRDVFEVGERDAATEDAPSSDRDTASRTSILGSLLAQRTIDMGPHGVGPVWLLGPLCLQEHSTGEGDDEVMRLRDMLRAIFCGERPGATADIGVDMPPLPPAVRRSLISAFQLVAAAGPLCDEPLLGVALVVSTRQLPPVSGGQPAPGRAGAARGDPLQRGSARPGALGAERDAGTRPTRAPQGTPHHLHVCHSRIPAGARVVRVCRSGAPRQQRRRRRRANALRRQVAAAATRPVLGAHHRERSGGTGRGGRHQRRQQCGAQTRRAGASAQRPARGTPSGRAR